VARAKKIDLTTAGVAFPKNAIITSAVKYNVHHHTHIRA